MTRRRRHVELPPRRRVEPTVHAHTDTCQLTAFENGEVVVYRGPKAVINWLNRVANLARERSGEAPTPAHVGSSLVRAPALSDAAPHPSRLEIPPASESVTTPTRDDPAAISFPDRLGF